MHLLADQLKHRAFFEVAAVLRGRAGRIAESWMEVVREVMPQMQWLEAEGLRDSIPQVLAAVADAMASGEREGLEELIEQASQHGFARFASEHDMIDLFQEERLLRGVIVLEIREALGRAMDPFESAALHATIDLVMQSSVLAMVERKKAQLREAAEAEVKYLAFFSHDLNNNLTVVDAALARLLRRLQEAADGEGMSREEAGKGLNSVTEAREAIAATTSGMRRLLEHERLRKSGHLPTFTRLLLCDATQRVVKRFESEAQRKGVDVRVHCAAAPEEAALETDEELLGLVLQNLVGNAVKFSTRAGSVVEITIARVDGEEPARPAGAAAAPPEGRAAEGGTHGREAGVSAWKVAIADQGPGIDEAQRKRLFQAFKRGEGLGQKGVGLGLAIVAQAAKLLEAELTVDSEPGRGSVFTVVLPERPREARAVVVPGGAAALLQRRG